MKFRSKRYRKVLENIDLKRNYSFSDAIEILKNNNFEKSKNLELTFSLNWSPKQSNMRDFVIVPFPVKREKIAVIDENVPSSLKQKDGVVFVSLEELPKIISKKKKSSWGFEKLFADSSVSDKLKPFAKALSLKKSFPNVKDGTLSSDLVKSIEDWEKGRVELRNDKGGNFHVLVGKSSFENSQLQENYKAIFKKIISLKPSNWKGDYLRSITLSTSMGPGVKISI